MSKLNYSFTPIPNYFLDNGWFDNQKMAKFILWAFRKCSAVRKEVYHDHKLVVLEPFEFIFGLPSCSEQTGLSIQNIRTLIQQLKNTEIGEILKKSTSKSTSKFTVYKWSTDIFCEISNMKINTQVTGNQQASNNKQEDKKEEEKNITLARAAQNPKKIIDDEDSEKDPRIIDFQEFLSGFTKPHTDDPIFTIPSFEFRKWLKKYPKEEISDALAILINDNMYGEPIQNAVKYVQSALAQNYSQDRKEKRDENTRRTVPGKISRMEQYCS